MKKKLLFRSLIGAPIGVLVSLIITIVFSLCFGHGEYFPAPHELIDWCGGNNRRNCANDMFAICRCGLRRLVGYMGN